MATYYEVRLTIDSLKRELHLGGRPASELLGVAESTPDEVWRSVIRRLRRRNPEKVIQWDGAAYGVGDLRRDIRVDNSRLRRTITLAPFRPPLVF